MNPRRDRMLERKQLGPETRAEGPKDRRERPPYQAPRVVKKRAVSRATLFTGSGPDVGGIVAA